MEATALARRLGDPATLVQVINDTSLPLRISAPLGERLAEEREALGLAEKLDDPFLRFWAAHALYSESILAGHFDEAERCLELGKQIADQLRLPPLMWSTVRHGVTHALMRGEAARAEELNIDSLELGRSSGQPDAALLFNATLFLIRMQQGRVGEVVDLIAGLAARMRDMPAYDSVVAWGFAETGRTDEARRVLDAAAASGFALPNNGIWLSGMVYYASAAIELDDPSSSEQLLQLLIPYRAQTAMDGTCVMGPVAGYLGGLAGVLGRLDEAEDFFGDAEVLNVRGRMRFAQALNHLWWGRMLVRHGRDAERGRLLLQGAQAVAAERGYASLEERAAVALRG